jgi:hypothetical protein
MRKLLIAAAALAASAAPLAAGAIVAIDIGLGARSAPAHHHYYHEPAVVEHHYHPAPPPRRVYYYETYPVYEEVHVVRPHWCEEHHIYHEHYED